MPRASNASLKSSTWPRCNSPATAERVSACGRSPKRSTSASATCSTTSRTRADLLDAVFRRQADRFRQELTERLAEEGGDARTDLLVVVDYWLGVQFDHAQSLFWHLWAISAHDDTARTTMTSVYDQLLNRVAKLLRAIHRRLGRREALQRAAAIGALIDGSGLYVGFGRRPGAHLAGLQTEIRRNVVAIIDRPVAEKRRRASEANES